jgi:glycosyltransferase involved in cell wall biosynthesis
MSQDQHDNASSIEIVTSCTSADQEPLAASDDVMAPLRAELELKDRELQVLRDQLRAIHTSDAWAMLRTLTQFRHAVAPHGTHRDQLARLAVKGLRRLKKGVAHAWTRTRDLARSLKDAKANAIQIDRATDQNYGVLCLPMIEWDFRFQRPQQMMRQLARRNHAVFYAANRFHRGTAAKLRGIEPNVVEVMLPGDPVANVYQTLPAPADTARMLEAMATLKAEMKLNDVVIVAQLPYWTSLAVALRARFGWPIVYDCMDDHSGFLHNSGDILESENQLLETADLVVTSSTLLHQNVASRARSSILIRNACEYDHFHAGASRGAATNDILVIGYYGAIAEWFDGELVTALARLRPRWRFELIGSTLAGDVRALEECPNIRFLGERPYADLPRLIKSWNVFVIPFKRIPLTEATNPVKVYEMLATGKPVVAVGLPELLPIAELGLIRLAATAEQFARAIEWELSTSTPELEQRRQAYAERNTWQARTVELSTAIDGIRGRGPRTPRTPHGRPSLTAATYTPSRAS